MQGKRKVAQTGKGPMAHSAVIAVLDCKNAAFKDGRRF